MKAVRLYGSRGRERVVVEQIPMPKLGASQVLIRVHATAVTQGELEWYPTWHTQKGDPRLHPVLSHEFSGVIDDVAPDVTNLRISDAVYGRRRPNIQTESVSKPKTFRLIGRSSP